MMMAEQQTEQRVATRIAVVEVGGVRRREPSVFPT